MARPAGLKKLPVHPMVMGFPIGLWVFALFCDMMRAATGNNAWQNGHAAVAPAQRAGSALLPQSHTPTQKDTRPQFCPQPRGRSKRPRRQRLFPPR
jgi:hypothetical protein